MYGKWIVEEGTFGGILPSVGYIWSDGSQYALASERSRVRFRVPTGLVSLSVVGSMGGSLEGSGRSYGALRTVRRRQNGLDLKCGGSETSWGPGRLLWQVSVLALGEFGRPSTSQLQGHIVNHLAKCS